MDADLQHPPEMIPKMLKHAEQTTSDLVIGSRFANGGSTPGLGQLRTAISNTLILSARVLFIERLGRVKDPLTGFFMVHRTKLEQPQSNSVAEHDHVSEVYHVISGAATLVTGPDLVEAQRRPATNENVRLLNGPGSNAASIRNGVTHQLKAGDAIIIPAGTGHLFTKIDDHITYIMIRIDPDKVVPWKDEAASKAYLAQQ